MNTDSHEYEFNLRIPGAKVTLIENRKFKVNEFFDKGGYLHRQPVRKRIIDEIWKTLSDANTHGW